MQITEIIITAITGLIGVWLGSHISGGQNTKEKKLDFYEKQLRELYSPLLGIREEIRILSEFRLEGERAAHEWWLEVSRKAKQMSMEDSQKYFDKEGVGITGQIEYENKQLTDKIIPSYRKMVKQFQENYWLADDSAKQHLQTLIKFVETWERYLSESHPREVLQKIQVSEEKLQPFYKELKNTHELLREKLRNRKI